MKPDRVYVSTRPRCPDLTFGMEVRLEPGVIDTAQRVVSWRALADSVAPLAPIVERMLRRDLGLCPEGDNDGNA